MNNVFASTNVDLYHLLELSPHESNQNTIKKNFSNLIKLFHSDKGGDSKFHQQLVEAYRILSDPTRKFIYDNFGIIGVYSLKEDNEDILIFETILTSPYSSAEDIEIIKSYMKKKILKKIKKVYFEFINADFLSADLTSNYTTGFLDFIYLKHVLGTKNIALGKNILNTRFALNNNFTLFKSKDKQKELSLNINYSVDKSTQMSTHAYSLNLNNKFILPYGLKLFENNYLDTDMQLEFHNDAENMNLVLRKSITFNNMFHHNPLSMTISPSYSLSENYLEGLEIELAHNASPSKSIKTKYDIFAKSLDSVFTWKPKGSNTKYIGFLNLGSNFLIGLYVHQPISATQARSHSIMLRPKAIFLSNESILIYKSTVFKLVSGLQFIKKKENYLSFNSTLSIQLQFKSFKFHIPIIIASKANVYTHFLIFFSTIMLNLGLKLYRKSSQVFKSKPPHFKVYDKINYERQIKFNQENLIYSLEIEMNKKDNGQMKILFAYIGEISKVKEIFKHIEIFGCFKNEDNFIFDIKVPLSLRIVESKLDLPSDITDIEGIFLPDYKNKDKLGYFVIYTYAYEVYSVINKNNEKEIFLP